MASFSESISNKMLILYYAIVIDELKLYLDIIINKGLQHLQAK